MSESPDWIRMEHAVAQLLPSANAMHDRNLLLAELAKYAQAVVREARRIGNAVPTAADCERSLCWLERPVFVCGHHRSGTTLLQGLLDGHPELVVLPSEASYFSSFSYVARADPQPRAVDRFIEDWIARFVDPNHEPHFKLGRSGPDGNPSLLFAQHVLGWSAALRDARPAVASLALLLALVAAFRDVAASPGKPRLWVEKTPCNESHVQQLAAMPDARFIQLVREPGATLASLLELYRAAGVPDTDVARHARTIRRSLQLAHKNMQRLGCRYLIVRYEDLTDDPAREMERVRDFVGISSSPSLLTPTVGGRAIRSNSSFDRGELGTIQRSRSSAILSPADTKLIRTHTASVARPLGYAMAPPSALSRSALHLRLLPRRAIGVVAARIRRHFLSSE